MKGSISFVLMLAAVGAFSRSATAAVTPTPTEVKRCVATGAERDRCLDGLFREFLVGHSTAEALKLVDRYGETDTGIRLNCHPIVHAIGRETFRLMGTIHDAFAACDHTCHSGCYHGAVERFIRADVATGSTPGHVSQEDLRRRVNEACASAAPELMRFQCLHGLGHAVMYFTGYQLSAALGICASLQKTWSQRSCYGGVFMENLFSATPERRDVSPTDFHYPCDRVEERYRSDCYLIQTSRMHEMGLSTEELFVECALAGLYRSPCVQSIGRDLSNDVRTKDPKLTARTCERRTAEDRRACIRGVVHALIDNTWDGRYAMPFCANLTAADDAGFCFRASAKYLVRVFAVPPGRLRGDCRTYLRRVRACVGAVSRERGAS